MKRKLIKLSIILLFLTLSASFFSCTDITKKITVSNDTQNEISIEENEVDETITNAKKLLSDNKYDEAKAYFIKAISLDKSNKDLYLEIKDIYIDSNRLDDAYFIIKTALINDVDTDNMNIILNEIASKFDTIKLSKTINQNSSFSLPYNTEIELNNNKITLPIYWTNSKVDTSKLGAFIYEGVNQEYGRKVELELSVTANNYDSSYGYIKSIYKSNDKIYADIDLVEFYTEDKALEEAIKDNKATLDSNGKCVYLKDYYTRNINSTVTTYELDKNFSYSEHYSEPVQINEELSTYVAKHKVFNYDEIIDNYSNTLISNPNKTFVKISAKNNMIYSIYRNDVYIE